MIALALILLLLAAALVVGIVVTGTSQEVLLDSTVGSFSTQPVWIFVAGVVATLLALLGFAVLGRGTRRRVARRREMKRLRRVEKEQAAQRTDETAERTDHREHGDVRDSASAAPAADHRAGYDEPDRHLVREPRAEHYDPEAGEHLAHRPDGTHADAGETVRLDEAARHRSP